MFSDTDLLQKSRAEVDQLLSARDAAVFLAHEEVRAGWPTEILVRDHDEDASLFFYERTPGRWEYFYCFGPGAYAARGLSVGLIYRRTPCSEGGYCVIPNALVMFDTGGTCVRCDTEWVQGVMEQRLGGEPGVRFVPHQA